MLPHWYLIVSSGLFGLIIGSFLNVLIYRVPAGKSLFGSSACMHCGHRIRWADNIPVLGWLKLRGKCRDCGASFPVRYLWVELGNALSWAALAAWLGWSPVLPLMLFFASVMIALAVIDFDTMRLPDVLTIPAAAITFLYLLVLSLTGHQYVQPFYSALWGGLIYTMFFLALWLLTGGRGLGFGDVKLAPTLGMMVGFFFLPSVFVGILGAFIVGGLPAGIIMALGKLKKGVKIPFGPMLIVGAWVGILWGLPIVQFYMNVSGLNR